MGAWAQAHPGCQYIMLFLYMACMLVIQVSGTSTNSINVDFYLNFPPSLHSHCAIPTELCIMVVMLQEYMALFQ